MDHPETYLGDGVYAEHDGYQVWIYRSNGIEKSQKIALEPEVLSSLVSFDQRIRATARMTAADQDFSRNGCEHQWVEGVDDDGQLVEPPYDVCYHCGARQD